MPQDSGYAWVICAASFLFQAVNGGFHYSAGIFYIMFKENIEGGDSAIAFITSLNLGTYLAFCVVSGVLSERYGERAMATSGTLLASIGIALGSLSTKVFHLYITLSLMAGVGMGLGVNASMTILSRHFNKYNKVAVGISMCGVGLGSFIWPPVMKALEETYGWRGAILMMAGIYSHSIIFTSLYRPVETTKLQNCENEDGDNSARYAVNYKVKEPNENTHKDEAYPETTEQIQISPIQTGDSISDHQAGHNVINHSDDIVQQNKNGIRNMFVTSLSLLQTMPFGCFALHFTLFFFPVMTIYTHFGNYILSHGFSKQDVVYLYMTLGITMTMARLLTGFITSFLKLNSWIVVMVCTILNGVFSLVIPFIQSFTLYIIYSVLFCLLATPTYILCLPIVMESVPPKQIATTYGIMNLITVPSCMLGAPFAAWLYGVTDMYDSTFYLSGTMLVATGLVMVPAVCHYPTKRASNMEITKYDV